VDIMVVSGRCIVSNCQLQLWSLALFATPMPAPSQSPNSLFP
jgi:hypothetical protein